MTENQIPDGAADRVRRLREQIDKMKVHVCSSCDFFDDERARREGYNSAIADVLKKLEAEGVAASPVPGS